MRRSPSHTIYNIIAKKFSGQASDVESKIFEEWLESSEDSKETLHELNRIWSENYFPEDTELVSQGEINEKIWQQSFEDKGKKRKLDFVFFLKIAAVFIVLLTTVSVIYFSVMQQNKPENLLTTILKQTLPGQKSTITLQDGTVVWLNSGSKISYRSDFNDSLRIVELEGQAYFEVFKDITKPFIVKCRNLDVEALGTSFDVNGYNEIPIQVSLLTGSVKLTVSHESQQNDMILNPGEYSVIDPENKFKAKGKFDPYEVLAWKENRLIFKHNTLDQIIPKLEMWYGINIEKNCKLDITKHFTGTFERENLDNILQNMGLTMGFKYEFKGNHVLIN